MRPDGASLVLATFAETKVTRLPGRTPATQKSTVIREFGNKEATHLPSNASQLENLKIHSDKHDMAVRPEPSIPYDPRKACVVLAILMHGVGKVPIPDRGREGALSYAPPPSEPYVRFSRIRLSGQRFYLRED